MKGISHLHGAEREGRMPLSAFTTVERRVAAVVAAIGKRGVFCISVLSDPQIFCEPLPFAFACAILKLLHGDRVYRAARAVGRRARF